MSIKKRIFDLSKVPAEDIRQIPNTLADYFSVEGNSHEEYQHDLTVQAGLDTKYKLFSGSVKTSFSSTDLSIAETGYVSIKLFMRYETWKLQTQSQEYMYDEVIDDFKNQDGKWLIEQYGAGVVMGMDVGGQWSDNYSVSKLYENATTKVAASMEAAYGSFIAGNGSTEISDAAKNEESIVTRRVNVVGGDPKFAPSQLENWQSSVQANLAFMNFTPDGLVAIWDLFPEYKEKLQQGFDEYREEHYLSIARKYLISCETVEGWKFTSSSGSGASKQIDLYKPDVSETDIYVGLNGDSNKILIVKQLSENYGAVCKPTTWHLVWRDGGSGNSKDYSCWIPGGPPDFVALGIYCRFQVGSYSAPSEEEAKGIVMVHKSLVRTTDLETSDVWNDSGSGATYDLTLGRLPHHALWPSNTTEAGVGELPTAYTFKDEYMQAAK